MPLPLSIAEYAQLIYGAVENRPSIEASTLTLWSIGPQRAVVSGEVSFQYGIRLRAREVVDLENGRIESYGYEVYRGQEKLYWYDSWPHLNDSTLASTFPHHKHIPPDAKHNRVPAPNLSSTEPNLPAIITEIETELLVDDQNQL
ncbi:MAG: hypothetical protein HY782_18465 [Chloroflexi bacterium]|nr:hypothetical protein [Chloroflexota bacterium]